MLGEHIERAVADGRRVLRAEIVGVQRRLTLHHLEAVGRHENGAARLVHAVIGAADALGKARGALRRADMDDQIDIAPIDAEIERRGGDDGAQAIFRHGLLHLAALADIERTVMQRDRQRVLVDVPEFLEQDFRLAACIDEEQRGLVRLDRLVDLGHRIFRLVARPGHARLAAEDGDDRLGAIRRGDEAGMMLRLRRLRDQPAAQVHRLGDGCGETDGFQARRQAAQARQTERQQMAALGGDERVQFVEDDVFQILEEAWRLAIGDEQRHLFGCRQQDVRRVQPLALAFGLRRVAGAGFHRDRQAHFRDRLHQVALDIDGERLERRDVKRVNAGKGRARRDLPAMGEVGQRRQEAGERLARAGRRDQQQALAGMGAGEQLDLVRARLPALVRKPAGEGRGQQREALGGMAEMRIGHRAKLIHAGGKKSVRCNNLRDLLKHKVLGTMPAFHRPYTRPLPRKKDETFRAGLPFTAP